MQADSILGSPGNFHFYAFATMHSNWYENEDDDDDFTTAMLQDRLEKLSQYCRSLIVPGTKKVANRPAGSVQHTPLRFLINQLYEAIVNSGRGRLTLSGDYDEPKGSLIDTLRILNRPLPEIVPAKLPSYPTLRRILGDAASSRPLPIRKVNQKLPREVQSRGLLDP